MDSSQSRRSTQGAIQSKIHSQELVRDTHATASHAPPPTVRLPPPAAAPPLEHADNLSSVMVPMYRVFSYLGWWPCVFMRTGEAPRLKARIHAKWTNGLHAPGFVAQQRRRGPLRAARAYRTFGPDRRDTSSMRRGVVFGDGDDAYTDRGPAAGCSGQGQSWERMCGVPTNRSPSRSTRTHCRGP